MGLSWYDFLQLTGLVCYSYYSIHGKFPFYILIKGKGAMNTYWLEDKVGGIPRSLEMTTPGFFRTESTSAAYTPEFLRDIFGSNDSEEEKVDALEAIQLNVAKLNVSASTTQLRQDHPTPQERGGQPRLTRNSTFLPSRCHICSVDKYLSNW